MTTPAAIAQLLVEHAAARERLAALQRAVGAAPHGRDEALATVRQIETALAYLNSGLELHIAKEEGPLFPRLKAALPPDDRLIDEMVAEHDLIRIKREDARLLLAQVLDGEHDEVRDELRAVRALLEAQQGAWPAALRAAVSALEQKAFVHFENEEELVFPLAPELLDAAVLEAAHTEMLALEAAWPTRSA